MVALPRDIEEAPRNSLEQEVFRLRWELAATREELRLAYENLSSVQARCTELLEWQRATKRESRW